MSGAVGSCRYEGNVIKLFWWNEKACRGGKGTSEEVPELCCYLLSTRWSRFLKIFISCPELLLNLITNTEN